MSNFLKGHCHDHLGQNACPNILQRTWFQHELLLHLREENIKVFLQERTNNNQFLVTSLKYTGQLFQVSILAKHS